MKITQNQAWNRKDENANSHPFLCKKREKKRGEKRGEPDIASLEEKQDGFIWTRKKEGEAGGEIDKKTGLYYEK